MTQDLYRKEALERRHRSLYGDVTLTAPLASWIITAMLASLLIIFGCLLGFGHVETKDGSVALWRWLLGYV